MQHVADGYALDIDVYLSAEERFITMLHRQGDEEENVLFLHRYFTGQQPEPKYQPRRQTAESFVKILILDMSKFV